MRLITLNKNAFSEPYYKKKQKTAIKYFYCKKEKCKIFVRNFLEKCFFKTLKQVKNDRKVNVKPFST